MDVSPPPPPPLLIILMSQGPIVVGNHVCQQCAYKSITKTRQQYVQSIIELPTAFPNYMTSALDVYMTSALIWRVLSMYDECSRCIYDECSYMTSVLDVYMTSALIWRVLSMYDECSQCMTSALNVWRVLSMHIWVLLYDECSRCIYDECSYMTSTLDVWRVLSIYDECTWCMTSAGNVWQVILTFCCLNSFFRRFWDIIEDRHCSSTDS